MIIGILSPIIFIGLIVLLVIGLRSGFGGDGIQGQSVRRFFQYALLFGFIMVVANGLTGLLGRLIESPGILISDQSELARNLSFVLVGVPLYVGIALWIRRQYLADPAEAKAFGWALYFTIASLTFLIGASLALRQVLSWVAGLGNYQGYPLAQFIIWSGLWFGHWWVNSRFTPVQNSRGHYLIGSFYSLVFLAVGLVEMLSGAFARLLNLDGQTLLISQKDSLVNGSVTALVGVLIWFIYWLRTTLHSNRDVIWLAYVMLAGAGGGLVMAIVSLTNVFYTTLVWIVGTPSAADASSHFKSLPIFAAAALVGGAIWWYHRTVLQDAGTVLRSEVRRIYEYLMSAIGLLATAIGFSIVLVALVDAFTDSGRMVGSGSGNTLLAAVTLLAVGGPIWWTYWSHIQKFVQLDPESEYASPTRRVYLFLLFGVGGVTAAITLLAGVFILFDDIFKGNFGEETVRRLRIPLALILSAGGVAGYHWLIYRGERDQYAEVVSTPRFVILVGPHDSNMIREISTRSGAKIQAWSNSGAATSEWNSDSIVQAIKSTQAENLLILSGEGGLEIVSISK